jgi:NitT/TauT family transport system permease protein
MPLSRLLRSISGIAVLLVLWQIAVMTASSSVIPGPLAALYAIGELATRGLLLKYVVASLFRVTWGYLAGVCLGIPFGIMLGLSRRAEHALNPLIQIFRPISALAWIPVAILWFGVGDLSAIFLIFLASFLPMTVTAMNAAHNIEDIYVNAGRNFGLSRWRMVRSILVPAMLPELLVGLRITVGIAWLVVVAAEMIAVNSGLGFLIVEARNAGNRYDLVLAGMVMIGLIGLLLDLAMRRLERLRALRWGWSSE